MVKHPLLTTIEEFNREKYYYKIYLVRINYIYKNKFDLIIFVEIFIKLVLGGGWDYSMTSIHSRVP